ncbi:MAG: acetyl-CoA carboxylase carboxyltransferase subunit alpha [Simkaniaceae bacterium]|nr:acetyl-CoA carboxylase carboxyltransferase subunit alpha [Simkaniaceae bacterium]
MLEHEKPIYDCEKALTKLKEQNGSADSEISEMESTLEDLKSKIYSSLTAWQRVLISRHPERPQTSDYISGLCDSFEELFGDRLYRDDAAIIGGLGVIGGEKFVIIGQEKGSDTDQRLKRNFGMVHPEGYNKALRLMKLAEKFNLPVLTLVDTPGAYPGLEAEERGQGFAIARNLMEMAKLKTPIVVMIIGEGCSGGALGIGVGDKVGMLEHSYYSVISPEGCASILWKDPARKEEAAKTLRMHAEDLLEFEVIDGIVREPQGGAHKNHQAIFNSVKNYVLEQYESLKTQNLDDLLENRYARFRKLGTFSE